MADEKKHSCPRCGYMDPSVTGFKPAAAPEPPKEVPAVQSQMVTATVEGKEIQIPSAVVEQAEQDADPNAASEAQA